ncbi:MAG TPA: protein-glutamate O-methyltransferase CheR [Polyangia bacterium]|nr:protein-glutamate O-methyltransferase CheR [Polyangia bacterium]
MNEGAPGRIDDQSFALLSRLVHRVAGIHLPPPKRALVEARLSRRLRAVGAPTFLDYYHYASRDEAELVQLVDAITTNETRFFRDPAHFALLRERVVPRWHALAAAGRRSAHVRAWSAACSTGEEPYSLAMTLQAELEPGWRTEVLATDLSTRVLKQAQAGEWPVERARQVPEPYRKRFLLRGTGQHEGRMRAVSSLKESIRFLRCNLHRDVLPAAQHDVIFCCNVLIYFDRPTRRAVVARLLERLAPDGLLFLGSAEIVDPGLPVRKIAPNVYAHAASGVRW